VAFIAGLNVNSPGADDLAQLGDDQIRTLKKDVKDTLGGLNGPVYEDADANGVGGTTLLTAATMSSWEARIAAVEGAAAPSSGSIPVGGIMVWYGDVNTIPAGWKQCDGSSYTYTPTGGGSATIQTPDLRGRTIFGPGAANSPGWNVGATPNWIDFFGVPAIQASNVAHTHSVPGGSYALTEANLPVHAHYMFANIDGNNTLTGLGANPYPTKISSTPAGDSQYEIAGSATAPTVGVTGSTGSGSAHSHGSTTSGTAGDHTHTINTTNPYLGLYHIMFVADGVPA
jgi:hypothetical protein